MFLGWTVGPAGRYYYIRQLRDMKGSVDVDALPPEGRVVSGELCGRTLARAHARSADPVAIAGYLGKAERFDEAMESFAIAYSEQVEQDFVRFSKAVESGEIPAELGL